MNLLWWVATWLGYGTPVAGTRPLIALRAVSTRVPSLAGTSTRVMSLRGTSTRLPQLDAEW